MDLSLIDAPRLRNVFHVLAAITAVLVASYVPSAIAEATINSFVLGATPPAVDLGLQSPETVVRRTVELVNSGGEDIYVLGVRPDCTCVGGEISQNVIPARGKASLELKFETRSYRGVVAHTLTILTTGGTIAIPVRVNVSPYRNWKIDYSTISVVDQTSAIVQIQRSSGDGARIISATAKPDFVSIALVPKDKGSYELQISPRESSPIGTHRIKVTVLTSDDQEPTLTLDLFQIVRGKLSFMPATLVMPVVKIGGNACGKIVLRGWTDPNPPRFIVEGGDGLVEANKDADGSFSLLVKGVAAQQGANELRVHVFSGSTLKAIFPVILRGE